MLLFLLTHLFPITMAKVRATILRDTAFRYRQCSPGSSCCRWEFSDALKDYATEIEASVGIRHTGLDSEYMPPRTWVGL